jgi:hypothetical protein
MIVLIWNIQTLGSGFTATTNQINCQVASNNIIAAIIRNYNADVVIVQEVMQIGGAARLSDIKDILNQNPTWQYDYVPGAITTGPANILLNVAPVFANLGYTQESHTEAYGVLWRNNVLNQTPAAMSRGAVSTNVNVRNNHYIDLVYRGLNPTPYNNLPPYINNNGLDTYLQFPIPLCPDFTGYPVLDNNGTNYTTVRRPCRVILNNVSGGGDVQCVVYHAPARNNANLYGSLIGLNSNQMQGNANNRCIYGGDFNLVTTGRQDEVRQYAGNAFTSTINNQGGANPSIIKFFTNGRWEGQHNLGDPRDYAFMRGNLAGNMNITDVIGDLATNLIIRNNNNNMAAYILAQAGIANNDAISLMLRRLDFRDTNLAYYNNGAFVGNFNLSNIWAGIRQDVNNGNNLNNNQAWIFSAFLYGYLISDHLPILVDYQ